MKIIPQNILYIILLIVAISCSIKLEAGETPKEKRKNINFATLNETINQTEEVTSDLKCANRLKNKRCSGSNWNLLSFCCR